MQLGRRAGKSVQGESDRCAEFLSLLRSSDYLVFVPMAYAMGFILAPLRGLAYATGFILRCFAYAMALFLRRFAALVTLRALLLRCFAALVTPSALFLRRFAFL